jgi:hypothetical protein
MSKKYVLLKLVHLAICLLLATLVYGQDYTYEFNKSGSLVKEPPTILLPNKKLTIKIQFDDIAFKNEVDSVLARTLKARIFWLTAQKGCLLFGDEKIATLLEDLKHLYNCLYNKDVRQLLSISDLNCDPTYSYTYCMSPTDVIKSLKDQYKVVLESKEQNCEDSLPLDLSPNNCCDWFYVGVYKTNIHDLKLKLYRNDPIKNLTIDYYNTKIATFPYVDWELLKVEIENNKTLLGSIDTYFKRIEITGKNKGDLYFCKEKDSVRILQNKWDTSSLKTFIDNSTIDYRINFINSLQKWLLYFCWLNDNGSPLLNPFNFTTPALYNSKENELSYKENSIDSFMIAKSDFLLKKQQFKTAKDFDQFYKIYNERTLISNKSDSLQGAWKKQQQSLGEEQKANLVLFTQYQQTDFFKNLVISPITIKDSIHLRNYFYKKNPDKRDFEYEYPDDEKIAILIHNVPASENTKLIPKISLYNEQPDIVSEGLGIDTTGFSNTLAKISTAISNFNIPEKGGFDIEMAPIEVTPSRNSNSRVSCKDSFQIMKNDFYDIKYLQLRKFDSLYASDLLPPFDLQKNKNRSPELRTVVYFPDGSGKAPFEYDYNLTIQDSSKNSTPIQIDSSYYKVGKRRLIELAMGFSYSLTPARRVNIDTTNGGFNISNNENKIQFLVGLKFHFLKKIYWEDNSFINYKNYKERLSLFIGASIPNPLDNLYSGLGIDLIPGLNVNTGVQWYKYTKYSIANGQITNQSIGFKPAWYVSVTTDPILLVKIIATYFQ